MKLIISQQAWRHVFDFQFHLAPICKGRLRGVYINRNQTYQSIYNMTVITVFLLLIFLTSCDLSSPEDIDEAEIKEILSDIETAFIFDDQDGIMQHYHPEFLHGNNSLSSEYIIWEIRRNHYETMMINDIEIELNNQFATVDFTLTFDDETTQEPSTQHGDMSYLYREYDDWKICGNNFILP